MYGSRMGEAIATFLLVFLAVAFASGIAIVLLAQWLWPILKAWLHWATG